VKLTLLQDGKPASENFYWLSAKPYADIQYADIVLSPDAQQRGGFTSRSSTNTADFSALQQLPPVKLDVSHQIERRGQQRVARVRLHNPTERLAFFIQLALTCGRQGDEVLPTFWSDNYFSLLPGESKEVNATFTAADLHGATPVLEVGGWNIETAHRCAKLAVSKAAVKAGEPFTVTATMTDTFLDGSRVALLVDGQQNDSRWAWARGSKTDTITFKLSLPQPGKHRLNVANRTVEVNVE
jgi:exo-1,4-beta-D-glucosaminidase